MQIVPENNQSLLTAVQILRNGGLVVYPTETVYGIGGDATNQVAARNLCSYKSRPAGKPFSIAVSDKKMAEEFVELNETAKRLYKLFLPGPMTIISKGKHKVADGIESENGTLGIRMPKHLFTENLIRTLNSPIVATSANAIYKRRPYKVDDILVDLTETQKRLIDLVIDAGELPHNEPSTVVDTVMDDPIVIRQGEAKVEWKNEVVTNSEKETFDFANKMWNLYGHYYGQRPIVFALEGPMGSGKTRFTKGLALAMGIAEEVVSPTFQIEIDYHNKDKQLIHYDVWRLSNMAEAESLGLGVKIHDKTIIVIEWADRIVEFIKRYQDEAIVVWIKFAYGFGDDERNVSWGVL